MTNAITWFEIPTTDLSRAATFYETILGVTLKRQTFMDVPHAIFSADAGVGGALIHDTKRKPVADGTVPYLRAPKLETALDAVASAGGKVVLGATDIGEPGTIALIRDTEGNLVGLHRPRG